MSETKPAKCVKCGKDIAIGKFASPKNAFCEEHKNLAVKPVPPGAKKDSPVDHTAVPGDPKPIAEQPIPDQQAQAMAPVADPKTSPELKEAFMAILGKKLNKNKDKLLACDFTVTQHGIINRRFADGRILSFIEIKGACIGVGITFNGTTEGYFDISTVHNLKQDEADAIIHFKNHAL